MDVIARRGRRLHGRHRVHDEQRGHPRRHAEGRRRGCRRQRHDEHHRDRDHVTLPQEQPQAPAAPPTTAAAKDAGALFGQLSPSGGGSGSGFQAQFSDSSSVALAKGVVTVAVVRNGQTVATDHDADANAFMIAVLTMGPDDELVVAGVPLSAMAKASLIESLRATADQRATAAAAAVKKVARPKIIGKTCANGRCKVKLQWPKTPGVYGATIAVGHKATGKADGYALAAVVLPQRDGAEGAADVRHARPARRDQQREARRVAGHEGDVDAERRRQAAAGAARVRRQQAGGRR